jgi:hypothetical protein
VAPLAVPHELSGLALWQSLEHLVETDGACALPGVSIRLDLIRPLLDRAVGRGFVRRDHADFVVDGLTRGFDCGIDTSMLTGGKFYANYPTATEARPAVSKAIRGRLRDSKSYELFTWDRSQRSRLPWAAWRVFSMGAVAKPMEPGVMRPFSDHTRSGLNAATDQTFFRHTLDAYESVAIYLKHCYAMRVGDVDGAFPLLPYRPSVWMFFLFFWFNVHLPDWDVTSPKKLYWHVCGDFGTAGMPGTWKIFFTDVMVGIARSEMILTLPMPVYVDDVAHIGPTVVEVNEEGVRFKIWLFDLGIAMKEMKDKLAALCNLYLGFWWDSVSRTRTLEERKFHAYLEMLAEFADRKSLTLVEMQRAAGRMQRAIMTLPPGAACFLANLFALMRGLSVGWQRRRTTGATRADFRAVGDLLQLNMGKGFFSLDQFGTAPTVDTDASRSRAYSGGGYASRCGRYRWWQYGHAAARNPIDYLEGDAVVLAIEDLGRYWRRKIVVFRIDNTSFQRSAVKGWSRAPRLSLLMRRLFHLGITFECIFQFSWLPTKVNVFADALSRPDGEQTFLDLVAAGGFELAPQAIMRRNPQSGATRRLDKGHRENSLGDGPPASSRSIPVTFTVPYTRASIFTGLPTPEVAASLDTVLDQRLSASSMRSAMAALNHWDAVRLRHGWDRIIISDDLERGGKLATFVLYMAYETNLVASSISNYVWGLRSWLKLQRQIDPVYGIVEWEDFMDSITVLTWVPSEPRKQVPLRLIEQSLTAVDPNSFSEVQAALLMLILLFTFSRSETPCPRAHTGEGKFDPTQHLMVQDVEVRSQPTLHLAVRLKAIKQDQRMERPEASGNEDWVLIGDVPGTPFSVVAAITALFRLHGGSRAPDSPFFTDAPRGERALTYPVATRDIRALWAKVSSAEQSMLYGLHGLRVAGYLHGKRGVLGEALAVAQGGWKSGVSRRYDRFDTVEVLDLSTQIAAQVRDDAPTGLLQAGPYVPATTPPTLSPPHVPVPPRPPIERSVSRGETGRRGLLRPPAAAPSTALVVARPSAAREPKRARVLPSFTMVDFTTQCGNPHCTVPSKHGDHRGACSDMVVDSSRRPKGGVPSDM